MSQDAHEDVKADHCQRALISSSLNGTKSQIILLGECWRESQHLTRAGVLHS